MGIENAEVNQNGRTYFRFNGVSFTFCSNPECNWNSCTEGRRVFETNQLIEESFEDGAAGFDPMNEAIDIAQEAVEQSERLMEYAMSLVIENASLQNELDAIYDQLDYHQNLHRDLLFTFIARKDG